MSNKENYFSEIKSNLEIAIDIIIGLEDLKPEVKRRADIVKSILSDMVYRPNTYNKNCSFNIKKKGLAFKQSLREISSDKSSEVHIDNLYVYSYRFLQELQFYIEDSGIKGVISSVISDIEGTNGDLKSSLINATYLMPAHIVKDLINNEGITELKDFNLLVKKAKQERIDLKNSLTKERTTTEQLKSTLEKYTDAFNFVGLYDGFDQLKKDKNSEKKTSIILLSLFGFLMLLPPIIEIIYLGNNLFKAEDFKNSIYLSFLPLITIEILLIYFFRIFLHNYKSIKLQLLQIDLRRTLCQFIQNYADYSKEIKSKDSDLLDKFENIIFSGIVGNEDNLPSTYDGLNQISDIFTKVTKK